MGVDSDRSRVAQLIRAIPPDHESPIPVDQLGAVGGLSVITLLAAFGVLRVSVEPGTNTSAVKADTPTAFLFLRSLAEHVEHGRAVLENWSRAGTGEPPYDNRAVLTGPQFLYMMEQRRLADLPDAAPLRRVRVSQVVIKRVGRWAGPQYLLVHDAAARQFQLPGGHARADDRDAREVAERELREELPGFVLDSGTDRLTDIGTIEVTAVSRTYGVVTHYTIAFFHLRTRRARLPTGPAGRWIGEDVLLNERGRIEASTLNTVGVRQLHDTLAGGVPGLPASLPRRRGGMMADLVRAKPLEFWGFVVGIAGLLASVVFFLSER